MNPTFIPARRTRFERLFTFRCAIRGWFAMTFMGGEYPIIHNWVGPSCRDCGDGEP